MEEAKVARWAIYIIIPTLHYSTSKTNPACATERKKKPVLPYVPRGLGRGRSTTDPVYFLLVFPSKSTCVSVLSSFRVGGEAAHTWKKRELEGGLDGGGLSLPHLPPRAFLRACGRGTHVSSNSSESGSSHS